MIDLAGSERAAQTQNTGKRMMEGIAFFLNVKMIFVFFYPRSSYQSIVTCLGKLYQCFK
jgi:hypothetical protein